MINKHPETCADCLLHQTDPCSGFIKPEGKGLIPLLICGEASGENEMRDNLPFRPYAESGSLLERALRSVGIERQQIVVTNLIHCRPPNNKLVGEFYEESAVQNCRQYLDAEVAKFKPRAILALGATPFKYLTGMSGRGKQAQDYTRGYPVESIWYPEIPVIGTYHPSFIRRGATELFPVIVHDLHKALMIARGRLQWEQIPQVSYQAGGVPELRELYQIFLDNPQRIIAYDLETKESSVEDEDKYDGLSLDAEILTVQFSHQPRTGVSVPWNEDTKPWIQRILALPNPRSGHNVWLFDEPQLRAKGIELPQLSRDTMALWHHLQPDLPANLSFVASFYGIERPWKHEMGQDFIRYGCIDVDAVQRIESKIEQDLRGLRYKDPATGQLGISLWEGFEQYVAPLRPVLQRMEERGIPRDAEATQKLVEYIDAEKERLNTQIQQLCPEEIKPVKTWVDWPEDLSDARKAYAAANLYTPISEKTGKELKPRVPVIKLADAYDIDSLIIDIGEAGYSWHPDGKRLFKRLPFLPNSTEHLKSYLRHWKIKIPVNLTDDETTGRTELDKLMKRLKLVVDAESVSKVAAATWAATFTTKPSKDNFQELQVAAGMVHQFLESVLTYRKLHKAKATYITGEGWTPNPTTGRIHTTFTLSATATLQLSSRKPNVQNIPKGKNPKDVVGTMLGKLLRQTVKAKPGHLIAELDYSGCHLVTMGLEAEDPQYIRVARIDGHSFLAAHMVNATLKSGRPQDLSSSEGWVILRKSLLTEYGSAAIEAAVYKEIDTQAGRLFIEEVQRELSDINQWLDYPDDLLRKKLAWVKKNFKGLRNDKAKPALLGNQLGLGARKLYSLNDDSFKNQAEAQRVQQILNGLFPKISAYQARTRALAQRQGYLISPYGSIRRFSEVERYDSRSGGLMAGMDAEKAGAFFVQTNAQGKLREAMLELEAEGWNERCNLINQVHDSLVYEMPIELCAEAIPVIAAIMERPAQRLKHPTICPEGLVLQCEASIGVDWGSIEEVKISNGKVESWPEAVRGLLQ